MVATIFSGFIVILMIAGIFLAITACIEEDFKNLISGLVIAMPGLLIIAGLLSLSYSDERELLNESQWDIYAIEDNMAVKGSRYYFEEDLKYYYMAKYNDGLKMYSIPTSQAYIVESDEQPKIIKYEYGVDDWLTELLHVCRVMEEDKYIRETEYKIVVPIGTVTNELAIDMK